MKDILRILIAPLVWLASFSAVYGLHGLICGHGIDGTVFGVIPVPRLLLVGAYGLAIVVQLGLVWALHSSRFGSPSPFVRFVSRATAWVGLVSAVWALLPTVTTTYCL
ncbi:hypothetical protein [Brevundimonas subvibrioides]|uniref:Uncharacterized protein n=1 Tax=Brevundimonas subvibrioides (strain ATCC 15264 / DSM 4735 / LMG 14903 / NBRC 16000 / CB 81) TaxID=633149 RepID=D9QIP4_BRESC|nr:hypothetical protein [Brevundimonas subvibrioides]ADL01377.1 conserved hypothetical protein [Brevundimonas subvibrioides ATCC 15264]